MLLRHTPYITGIHKRFKDILRKALIGFELLVLLVLLTQLGITDTPPVEVRTIEHANRVELPLLRLKLEQRRHVGERVRRVANKKSPGGGVRRDVRKVTDQALGEAHRLISDRQDIPGVDTGHGIVTGILIGTLRGLGAIPEFDTVRESPVSVGGDVSGQCVIDLTLGVSLFRKVVEPSYLSPHNRVDLLG